MIRWTSLLVTVFAVSAPAIAGGMPAPASATPVEWRAVWEAANAPYKRALFASNQGDAETARRYLALLEPAWARFRAVCASKRPEPFRTDTAWTSDLTAISRWIESARDEVASGKVHEAHDTLEQVRIRWMEMRTRAGIQTFGDHLTRFHEPMEVVVTTVKGRSPETFTDADMALLRETIPDLKAVWTSVRSYRSDRLSPAQLEARRNLTEKVWAVIGEMDAALRSGDRAAVLKAGSALRPAYVALYMRFG